jgi:hypothetical protein
MDLTKKLSDVKYLQDSTLFKVGEDKVDLKNISASGFLKRTVLTPVTNPINVISNFDWKNRGEDVSEVPSIRLKEYKLAMSGVAKTIKSIYDTAMRGIETFKSEGLTEAINDPYAIMYQVESTDNTFEYIFPWLLTSGATIRNIRNQWSDMAGKPANESSSNSGDPSVMSKIISTAVGAAVGAMTPGIGMESTYTFSKTDLYSVTIKFPLYNTFDVGSTRKNFDLVNLLTFQNLKNRTSLVTYVPPSVYTVSSGGALGGIYMPIAYMEDLKIESIGTFRKTDEIITGEKVLVPEAYLISITMREMIPQSTNIFEGTLGADPVKVISDRSVLADLGFPR